MAGYITKRTILRHPVTFYRCYGGYVLWRVIVAPKGSTFLGLLTELGRI